MEFLNRRAKYDYFIEETIEAGIVLKGSEIKSLRAGKASLSDSFATIRQGEVFLVNMYIGSYKEASIFNHEEKRSRKLLLHKKEIKKLDEKLNQDGYSLIALKLYFKKNKAKILLGLGKGKKNIDKREAIKERQQEREMRAELKRKNTRG